MDEIDLIIIKELWANSRITIRELSDNLDISVNSVHKRVNNLVEEGIIESFILVPVNLHPASAWVLIFGKSNSPSLEKAIHKLGKKGNINKVVSCLDNWVMINGHLRKISDLNNFTEDVVRELAIEDYTFGILTDGEMKDETPPLSKLDYQICNSMANNSRKSMSDVAKELSVTPKTVKRRLAKMEEEGSVYARIQWQPAVGSEIISYMYLTLKPGITRQEVITDLSNDFTPHFIQHYEFSNLPDFLLVAIWGKTLRQINDLQHDLKESGKFKKVTTNVQYKAYHFDTWAHEYVRKMGEIKKSQ